MDVIQVLSLFNGLANVKLFVKHEQKNLCQNFFFFFSFIVSYNGKTQKYQ